MKALILKDLLNIGSHLKTTMVTFLVLAVCLLPSTGLETYVFIIVTTCCTMTISTFSYDEASHWMGYALTMPVTRRMVVLAKFVVLGIFTLVGIVLGMIVGIVGSLMLGKIPVDAMQAAPYLLLCCPAFALGMVLGGTAIPLVFRLGAEKARMAIFVSALLPAGILFGVYMLVQVMGIAVSEEMLTVLLAFSPVAALVWDAVMYRISCGIFLAQDIS